MYLHSLLARSLKTVAGMPLQLRHSFANMWNLAGFLGFFREKDFLGLLVLTAWQAAVLGPLMNPCLFSMIPSPLFHSCGAFLH